MSQLISACIIAQSGGPTAVINASAAGAIETALESKSITRVLAAENGIVGILEERLFDCASEDREQLRLMKTTPASALGSCRHKLKDPEVDESEYERILEVFKKHDIRYFFYNGGNDSMDTCDKISKYMQKAGYECRVMGIPKTVDNDLFGTDHCPGFGSAAKYIATSVAEISRDNKVYDMKSVIIFELMGRNAGWLTASSALACNIGEGPDLIYLPESIFSMENFLSDIKRKIASKNSVIVAVSEGIKDIEGRFISEYGNSIAVQKDAFGHSQMGGLASILASAVKSELDVKVRGIELSLLQRCAAHWASEADIEEAYMAGSDAVKYASAGETDKMVAFRRITGAAYTCETVLMPLSDVANKEKKVPMEWINAEGNGVTNEFFEYALPLIRGESEYQTQDGLPLFAQLKKVFV